MKSRMTYIIYGILAIVALFVVIKSQKKAAVTTAPNQINDSVNPTAPTNPIANTQTPSSNNLGGTAGSTAPGGQEAPAMPPAVDPSLEPSNQAKKVFATNSHLNINLPDSMRYRELDLGEDIAAITGDNEGVGTKMSVLAKRGNYNESDVKAFFADYGPHIPGFKNSYLSQLTGPATRIESPEGSGLQKPYIWKIQDGSEIVTVALVQRMDGKGTYLTILSGPSSYFNNNETEFDTMYKTLKAAP